LPTWRPRPTRAFLSGIAERTAVEVPERGYDAVAAPDACVGYVAAA
jgi:hypothetical protein